MIRRKAFIESIYNDGDSYYRLVLVSEDLDGLSTTHTEIFEASPEGLEKAKTIKLDFEDFGKKD